MIRYLYQETSEEEKAEIDKALQRDVELQALYHQLNAVARELDSAQLEPSAKTISSILNYSRNNQGKA